MIIVFFLDKKIIKKFLFLIGILFMFVIFVIINYDTFAERYQNQIYKNFSKYNYNVFDYINSTEYGKLYHTGIVLFLNNKTFKVGNKNFRLLCDENEREKFLIKNNIKYDKKLINQKFEEKFRCNTHPHQIYIEILSEHGIFGFIVLISLIILFVKQNLFVILKHKNTVLACKFLIILSTFIPLIPGGKFFTSFNATLFLDKYRLILFL